MTGGPTAPEIVHRAKIMRKQGATVSCIMNKLHMSRTTVRQYTDAAGTQRTRHDEQLRVSNPDLLLANLITEYGDKYADR